MDQQNIDEDFHNPDHEVDLEEIKSEEMDVVEEESDDEDLVTAVDNSEQTFEGHNGNEVYCVNIHPTEPTIAVSGGMDDKAHVWNIVTGQTIFECTGHKDSVTFADFNKDGTLIATGDLKGFIQVWKLESQQQIWEYESSDLEWMKWHPLANVLLAGYASGEVWMWKIPSHDLKVFSSAGCRCTSGDINPDGKTATFGYEDGSLRIYDLKTSQIIYAFTKGRESHKGEINQLSYSEDCKSIATASTDGCSKVINTSTGKVVTSFKVTLNENNKDDEADEISVESASISSRFNLLAFGSLDSYLYVWNLRSNQIIKKIQHPKGISKILWDSTGMKIFTACLDGICRVWNRSGECLNSFHGAEDFILDMTLSKDEKILLAASADGCVRSYSLID